MHRLDLIDQRAGNRSQIITQENGFLNYSLDVHTEGRLQCFCTVTIWLLLVCCDCLRYTCNQLQESYGAQTSGRVTPIPFAWVAQVLWYCNNFLSAKGRNETNKNTTYGDARLPARELVTLSRSVTRTLFLCTSVHSFALRTCDVDTILVSASPSYKCNTRKRTA